MIKLLPSPLIVGFVGGIGGSIIGNETSRALGIVKPAGASLLATLSASDMPFKTLLEAVDPASVGLAVLTVAVASIVAKRQPRCPAVMIAVAASTALQTYFQFPSVETIGILPSSLPLPSLPRLPSASDLGGIALCSALLVCKPLFFLSFVSSLSF